MLSVTLYLNGIEQPSSELPSSGSCQDVQTVSSVSIPPVKKPIGKTILRKCF